MYLCLMTSLTLTEDAPVKEELMHIKSIFAVDSTTGWVISENRPQFTEHVFKYFSIKDRFNHVMSYPHNSLSTWLVKIM